VTSLPGVKLYARLRNGAGDSQDHTWTSDATGRFVINSTAANAYDQGEVTLSKAGYFKYTCDCILSWVEDAEGNWVGTFDAPRDFHLYKRPTGDS
jgi:hypothetical protein